jgi:tetratricopeptide (TPR) repeat protein
MKRPVSVLMAAMLVASLAIVAGACSQGSPATEHYNQAGDLADEEKWEEAIAELDQAIELDPEFSLAYIARANAHFSLEQFEQAVVDYTKAIELDPDSALAYANRGSAYAALGQMAQARADYETALPLASDPALLSQIDQGLAFASAIPEACQAARSAFHDWSAADHAAAEAGGSVIGHSIDLNVQVGQGLSENIQRLSDELNADRQTALQLADEAAQLRAALSPQFDSCLPLIADLPQACVDEMGQYADVMLARGQIMKAQTALLEASTAVRDAQIAGDEGAVDAAVDQVATAGDQLSASKDNWNDIVAPVFDAAVEACNAALSKE